MIAAFDLDLDEIATIIGRTKRSGVLVVDGDGGRSELLFRDGLFVQVRADGLDGSVGLDSSTSATVTTSGRTGVMRWASDAVDRHDTARGTVVGAHPQCQRDRAGNLESLK